MEKHFELEKCGGMKFPYCIKEKCELVSDWRFLIQGHDKQTISSTVFLLFHSVSVIYNHK